MQLRYEHALSAPPELVWPWLAVPELINRWSTARITPVLPGDQGLSYGVGATRYVDMPAPFGRTQRLHEVIEVSEPPDRLVYRVVHSPPIRSHRGEIRLVPEGDGSRLLWTVDIEFAVPALEPLTRRFLDSELFSKSMSELNRALVADVPARAGLRQNTPEDSDEVLQRLFAEARAVAAAQRAHADTLFARENPKRWFARVFQYTTEAQIEHAERPGATQHPGWILRLVPVFHRYYFEDNLLPSLRSGEGHRVERHWRVAFQEMERQNNPKVALFLGLRCAIIAHIEHDLPRTLAEVYADHYAGLCDYARFRADYLLMAELFDEASARLVAEIPRSFIPWYYHLAERFLMPEVARAIERRSFYDVGHARREAFERGKNLARMLVHRMHS